MEKIRATSSSGEDCLLVRIIVLLSCVLQSEFSHLVEQVEEFQLFSILEFALTRTDHKRYPGCVFMGMGMV